MTTTDSSTGNDTVSWADLPATVTRYIDAHRDGDDVTALGTFAQDAAVTDEGRTYRGRDEIHGWLTGASTEFTFTIEFAGATRTGEGQFDVVQHLEGNFPGGTADLHYRFVLDGERIARLVIEP